MEIYIKKLISQKKGLEELYERFYDLEDQLRESKANGGEDFDEIYKALIELKKEIEKTCDHPIFFNVSFVPDVFKCAYCGKEIWEKHILDVKEERNEQNPILYSPKNPYFGYVARSHHWYNTIRDEYLLLVDEIEENEEYDLTIPEIDNKLDQRFTKRLKNLPSATKRLARRKENNK
ncbi:MAG: hypothetical protein IKJ43_03400 [Bacilli bacterium]|nr:hypothetical protein [Bacilli bacterium]